MIIEITVGLAVVLIVLVGVFAYSRITSIQKTLDSQKKHFHSDEVTAGTVFSEDNVGMKRNLAVGSNLGVYGDFGVAGNAGVVGSFIAGRNIVSRSNISGVNVFSESSFSSNATIGYGKVRNAGFSNAGFSNASFSNAGFSNASFNNASFNNASFNNAGLMTANITNANITSASFSKFAVFNDRADFGNSLCMTDNGKNVCVMSEDFSMMKTLINTDILNLQNTLSPVASQLVGISTNLTIADIREFKNLLTRLNKFDPTKLPNFTSADVALLKSINNSITSLGAQDVASLKQLISNLTLDDINTLKRLGAALTPQDVSAMKVITGNLTQSEIATIKSVVSNVASLTANDVSLLKGISGNLTVGDITNLKNLNTALSVLTSADASTLKTLAGNLTSTDINNIKQIGSILSTLSKTPPNTTPVISTQDATFMKTLSSTLTPGDINAIKTLVTNFGSYSAQDTAAVQSLIRNLSVADVTNLKNLFTNLKNLTPSDVSYIQSLGRVFSTADAGNAKTLFGNLNSLNTNDVSSVKNVTAHLPLDTIRQIKAVVNAFVFSGNQISVLQNLANVLQGVDLRNMGVIAGSLNQDDINRIKGVLANINANGVGGLSTDQVSKLKLFASVLDGSGKLTNVESSGNIVSSAGTLGPTLLLNWDFQDVRPGGVMTFSKEPGNTASGWGDPANGVFSVFHWGFLPNNSSGEKITWNKARLIIRAVNLGDGGGNARVRIQQFYYGWNNNKGDYKDVTNQFDIICPQRYRGYMTNISPWFTLLTTDVPGLVLRLDSSPNNDTMRFGSVHIQFAS
jgi:uncharacterized protein YjbI with pentapeptide repeats